MSHMFVRAERVIDAPPEVVFAALADYNNRRPRMLTPAFSHYTVEQGGYGKGTVITYVLQAGGRERSYRMVVDEPQQSQLLVERDSHSSLVTRWFVHPLDEGQRSRVTVESEWEGGQGVGGVFERIFAPLGLRSMYHEMLATLARLTQTPEKTNAIMKIDKKALPPNTGMAMLALGSALALAAGLNYLRTRQRS